MERLKSAVEKILIRVPIVRGKGEEATKQSLVLPLLDSLGYDIWNPAEVCPEYEADFAVKKYGQREKVDFAISPDGVPRIYMEVKAVECPLDGHEGQLARYFNATPSVSLAVLTNGLEYRFYTDTAEANVMDMTPFHISKFDAIDPGLEVLARFQKSVFSAEAIRGYARELNHTAKIVSFLREQLDLRDRDASDEFVRWILGLTQICEKRVTVSVVEDFSPIVKNALQIVLRDIIRRSIAALDNEVSAPAKSNDATPVIAPVEEDVSEVDAPVEETAEDKDPSRKIVTTNAELESFAVVKDQFDNSVFAKALIFNTAARREVPIQLAYKDTTGYFGIYFNKPSGWVIRLVLGTKTQWVGFNVSPESSDSLIPHGFNRLDPHPWAEFRIGIKGPQDLYALSRLVLAAFRKTIDDRLPKAVNFGPATGSPETLIKV